MPKIIDIALQTSMFVDHGAKKKKAVCSLGLDSFERKENRSTDDGPITVSAKASFDLFDNVNKPGMLLMCSYEITYLCHDQEDAKLIPDQVILAHLIPYLREHVTNLTAKSRFPVVYLDTVNTHMLMDKFRAKTANANPDA
jgi:hypothetical protein